MNLFFSSLCAISILSTTIASAQTLDTLTWLDSQLPANQFIGVDAEQRQAGHSAWTSVISAYQPFKTSVNRSAKQVYWRKDSMDLTDNFYGELWSYDVNSVALHAETFPMMPNVEGSGPRDSRIDRFRLFVNAQNSAIGRVLAPRILNPAWNYSQTVNTYLCGVSNITSQYTKTNGFQQINAGSCPLYQSQVRDTSVTAKIVSNYDVLEDGPLPANAPGVLPAGTGDGGAIRTFQQALIIEQVMAGTSRERFIFGYNGGTYYGIIRWDASTGVPGNWSVINRTIGLRVLTDNTNQFNLSGMAVRGQSDQMLPPAQPANLTTGCIAFTDNAIVHWSPVPGATSYRLKISDLDEAASSTHVPSQHSKDMQIAADSGSSYIFPTIAGHQYTWSANAVNSAGASTTASTSSQPWTGTCAAAPTTAPTLQPNALTATCLGNIATLQWNAVANATGYDVRSHDTTAGAWNQSALGPNDRLINNYKGNSYTFLVSNAASGHQFTWWIFPRNNVGVGPLQGGANFTCPNYPAPQS